MNLMTIRSLLNLALDLIGSELKQFCTMFMDL